MFTPEVLTVPVFGALGSGAVVYPTIGAVLVWMLTAAFVGSVLGLLREALRTPQRRRGETRRAVELPAAPAARAPEYREAA